jgi:hypothetical protein
MVDGMQPQSLIRPVEGTGPGRQHASVKKRGPVEGTTILTFFLRRWRAARAQDVMRKSDTIFTAGDGERDAGTEPGSLTVDVYPPSGCRRRTGSSGEGSGSEGLATAGRGGVDGEAAARLPLLERYTIPRTLQNSCWRFSLLAL